MKLVTIRNNVNCLFIICISVADTKVERLQYGSFFSKKDNESEGATML